MTTGTVSLDEETANAMWYGDGYATKGDTGDWDGEKHNTGYELKDLVWRSCIEPERICAQGDFFGRAVWDRRVDYTPYTGLQ